MEGTEGWFLKAPVSSEEEESDGMVHSSVHCLGR
jgi:hypothetical protein